MIDVPASQPRPRLVVGAAVVDDLEAPRTLLAARRTEPATLAGGWELPGGKVEPGEEPEAALHRELAEELGITVQLGPEVTAPDGADWPVSPAHRMRVWLVRIVAGDPVPLEDHDALRVLGPGEWLDVEWLPADVPVVRALSERAAECPDGGSAAGADAGSDAGSDGGPGAGADAE